MLYDADREECAMRGVAGVRCDSRASRWRFDGPTESVHMCGFCGDGPPGQSLEARGYRKVHVEGVSFLDVPNLAEQEAIDRWGATFDVWRTDDGAERLACHLCGQDVIEPSDVRRRYCVRCNRYHTPRGMPLETQRRYAEFNALPPTG